MYKRELLHPLKVTFSKVFNIFLKTKKLERTKRFYSTVQMNYAPNIKALRL